MRRYLRTVNWKIFLAWIGANLAALVAQLALATFNARYPQSFLDNWIIAQLSYSLIAAVFQWAVIRKLIPNALYWIPATVLGWTFPVIVVSLVPLTTNLAQSSPILSALLTDATLGVAQWVVLRPTFGAAWLWIVASGLGFVVRIPVRFVPESSLIYPVIDFFIDFLAYYVITGIALGMLAAKRGEGSRQANNSLERTGDSAPEANLDVDAG